ncbi:citrate (Si)-synthase, eukaryotic [Batrachochytrium salamandrivorans]|nr:citrate (Si)-synthase, eukaryotic [Batrachochytrium salamandrivorans]
MLSASKLLKRTLTNHTAKAGSLSEALKIVTPLEQEKFKNLKKNYGDKVLGQVTVDQALGGARDVHCLVWEPSLLDAQEGIRFRGMTIPECQQALPSASGKKGGEPGPEALLWLLMTGEVPTAAQAATVTKDLHARAQAKFPAHVETLIRSLPKTMHPMTQLSIGVLAMQTQSEFAKAYSGGVHKSKYADYVLEDCLNLIAFLPRVAALIYRNTYFDGKIADYDASVDYSKNFNQMLGFSNNESFDELMRLYLVIHSDHEGGNASAHATHLVGSTLSDPYYAFSGGMNALAGPLHGLANQEVLRWLLDLQAKFKKEGKDVNKETIKAFAWETLKSGKVIPGYGHAVLRKTDPRYTAQREFALKYMPEDPLFKIVGTVFEVVPGVLHEQGKTKNPWPNVDSHSGALLYHYGFTQESYYTVLFGVSRAFGVLSQLYWSRALGFPLERPKSMTSDWIVKNFEGK